GIRYRRGLGLSRCGLGEVELLAQRGGDPEHLLALRRTGNADARLVEYLVGADTRAAHFLDELADEDAVGPVVVDHLARRPRRDDERADRSRDRRQSGRHAAETALVGVWPRRIEDQQLDARTLALDVGENRFDVDAVAPDIVFRPDLGI